MRVVSVLWRVLMELVALLVVLAMFKVAQSHFETIVISGLTLIYASVRAAFAWLNRGMAIGDHARFAQFFEIAKSLTHPKTDDYQSHLQSQSEELQKTETNFWISAVATWIMSLIAMWKLLTAVAS